MAAGRGVVTGSAERAAAEGTLETAAAAAIESAPAYNEAKGAARRGRVIVISINSGGKKVQKCFFAGRMHGPRP